ncbi:hypothetical protein OG864_44985 [Streptomyces sp. NBC_00124]|uniref:hypothetical protein n=1 Tax=Streptomyces sp. NBC_00124 TaxID=2975662 RepID=UPI0022553D7C|nr:hypothetical protein [Streptomyces sp. NBC_00124]MCX5365857.1 hypothetical protein [Streptomyces sp. NBC_00124]
MNAETFNARYPVGTPVFAYPGARPEDIPSARRIVTRTRTEAQSVGLDRDGVVWVEDHGAYISLTHVDPVSEDVWQAAKEAEALAAAEAEAQKPKDTLPAWLYQRFNRVAPAWTSLSDADRSFWEHEAAAVCRAVARDGFREPVTDLAEAVCEWGAFPVPAGPHVTVEETAVGTRLKFTPAEAGEPQ